MQLLRLSWVRLLNAGYHIHVGRLCFSVNRQAMELQGFRRVFQRQPYTHAKKHQ